MKPGPPRLKEDNGGGVRGAPLLCGGSRGSCLLHSRPRCRGPGPTDRPGRRAAGALQTEGPRGRGAERGRSGRASYLPLPLRALPRAFPLLSPLPLQDLLLLLQLSLSNFFNRSRSVSHFAGGSAEQGGAQRPVPAVQVAAAAQMRFPGGGRRDAPPPARPPRLCRIRARRPGRSHCTCPSRCVRPASWRRPRGRQAERAPARPARASLRQPRLAGPDCGLRAAGLPAAAPCAAARCGARTALPPPPAQPVRGARKHGSRGFRRRRRETCHRPGARGRAGSRSTRGRWGPSCRDRPGRAGEQAMPTTRHPQEAGGDSGFPGYC